MCASASAHMCMWCADEGYAAGGNHACHATRVRKMITHERVHTRANAYAHAYAHAHARAHASFSTPCNTACNVILKHQSTRPSTKHAAPHLLSTYDHVLLCMHAHVPARTRIPHAKQSSNPLAWGNVTALRCNGLASTGTNDATSMKTPSSKNLI